jgi:hypothetical protein
LLKKRSAVAVSGEQLLRQCYEKLQEHIRWRPVPPNQLGLRELPELVAGQSFSFAQEQVALKVKRYSPTIWTYLISITVSTHLSCWFQEPEFQDMI